MLSAVNLSLLCGLARIRTGGFVPLIEVGALPLYQNLLANAAGATIESYFVNAGRLRGDARDRHLFFALWAQRSFI